MRLLKKISVLILFALLGSASANAQHYVGVRGGYGGGLGRFYPAVDYPRYNQQLTWGLWSGGVAWKYYGPQKYIGGVGSEVEFLQRGFEYHETRRNSDTTYRRVINSINVPFIWQPHINMAGNHLRVFANLGIAASWNFSSQEYRIVKGEGVIFTRPYEMRITRDNPFGFGLQGGLGFNVMFGKWEFSAEGRYYFTYGDVLRNRTVFPGENVEIYGRTPLRSPVDNVNFSVGFFYCISGEPHNPLPGEGALRRKAAKQAEKEAKQLEKQNRNGNDKTTKSSKTDTEGR